MYKAFQNKNYYLAINIFPKARKKPPFNRAYLNGFRKWKSDDMTTYAIIIGTFRIMFGVKKSIGCCNC